MPTDPPAEPAPSNGPDPTGPDPTGPAPTGPDPTGPGRETAVTDGAAPTPASTHGTASGGPRWRTPWIWRVAQWLASWLVPAYVRLRVTGEVPRRSGPLILAGNHIGTFDPFALVAACQSRRIRPRIMATGGLFRTPVIGRLMRAAGHIPVDRGRESVTNAVPDAVNALRAGAAVFIYPEGRIGLDPAMWPERAKTGLARLALSTRAPVVPVAIWGSHEVIAYHGWRVMLGMGISTLWRRPTVRVHFGPPVDLDDLREGVVGHAQRASDRVMDAIARELAPLRADEPRLPRFVDPTRPLSTARLHRRSAAREAAPGPR